MCQKICPKCSSKKVEEIKFNDKNEAIAYGALGATGSGLVAAGVIGTAAKLGIGAKIVASIAAASGGIAAPIAIPAAAILGGSILALKAYSKTKIHYRCKKCGQIFE